MEQADEFLPPPAHRGGGGLRPLLIAVPVALALGALAMLWALQGAPQWPPLPPLFSVRSEEPPAPPPAAELTAAAARAASRLASDRAGGQVVAEAREVVERVEQVAEQVAEQQGGIDARVAAMEQRLTQLDLRSQAAAGNAARAEALLIAFAARRAIERGAPLGYLADQLRLRFGDARPNSVQTVIDAAQNPMTLDQLLARLDGLATTLMQSPAQEGMGQWLAREMSQLFVIRREDTPSPVAERRLVRARLYLESGRTEAAIAEIRKLPNAAAGLDWIEDAERYAAAQRALELIETTAVLEPRDLRDRAGARVEQRSPLALEAQASRP